MANSTKSDPVLDAQHEANCQKISNWLLKLSKECLYAIIRFSDDADAVKAECDQRAAAKKRGEEVVDRRAARSRRSHTCRVCGEHAEFRELCNKHRQRMIDHGDPMVLLRNVRGVGFVLHRELASGAFEIVDPELRAYVASGSRCVVCGRPARRDRLCARHYDISLLSGTPGMLSDDVVAYERALALSRRPA